MIVHCLFEQSGTFRDEFRKLGFEAYDYDIDNYFGKTDYQIDIFQEIQNAYQGNPSIFDSIADEDLVVAFFPCTRFSALNVVTFSEKAVNYKTWSRVEILEQCIKYNEQQSYLYGLLSMLFIIALKKKFKMVVENPYTQPHFLTLYFPIKPSIIDSDRRLLGDVYCKPTQYWFINFEPKNNKLAKDKQFNFGPKRNHSVSVMDTPRGISRSLIASEYAKNFIMKYILNANGEIL